MNNSIYFLRHLEPLSHKPSLRPTLQCAFLSLWHTSHGPDPSLSLVARAPSTVLKRDGDGVSTCQWPVADSQWRQRWDLKKGRVEVHGDDARWLSRLRGFAVVVAGCWWQLAVVVFRDFFRGPMEL